MILSSKNKINKLHIVMNVITCIFKYPFFSLLNVLIDRDMNLVIILNVRRLYKMNKNQIYSFFMLFNYSATRYY